MTTGVPLSTAPRRRSPARTFLPLAVAAWLIMEIWLLSLVAGAAGGLTVFALLAGGMVLGVVVIKRAGRRAFKNLADTFQQAQRGQQPTPQQPGTGNGLTMLAGLLLIMPGLLSDLAGLFCLLPPVRAWIGRRAARSLERKMASAPAGSFGDAFQQARIRYPDGKVVQGEVIREDRPHQPGPAGPDTGYRAPLTP
ncbi:MULTISPECIES: FxsA family membrane protein [unclassified Streptomyces]|uniref:FxsA family membrane protein n=1 Tax=unclassified Streptomyces TaxID=2593676 RepID=UPI001BECB3F1|nr:MULTISPECIES: FxsA family membrane protein [unclassified Streptomyces]MBT2407299.1 FxsA family protein [Streptomyces sp. ISL-21]MBT2459398.1 FxsA family protein [Streptomyces sp. ISL-86]MBT2613404.1 FxsA family protein [Streptomyces sp. ISL-87]